MEAKHRYRLLIYFAALILCLSVCFANAEIPAAAVPTSDRATVIFEYSHGHSAFMPALQQTFLMPQVASTAEEHVVPPSVLKQVTDANRSHHFWHAPAKHRASLLQNHRVNTTTGVTIDARNTSNNGQSE